MDARCLRKLKSPPKEFCPAAIARLRWRDQLEHEPSEEEERSAPGCGFAIRSHESSFCFWKSYEYNREKLTDSQIAHMLGISEATIKKVGDRALKKSLQYKPFKELKEMYGDETIIEERLVDPNEDRLIDLSGLTVSRAAEDDSKPDKEPT